MPTDTVKEEGRTSLITSGIEHPTRYQKFPVKEIAEHADLCATWIVETVDLDTPQESGTAITSMVQAPATGISEHICSQHTNSS